MIIVDNYFDNPNALRQYALQQEFTPCDLDRGESYYGVRTDCLSILNYNLYDAICRNIIERFYASIGQYEYKAYLHFQLSYMQDKTWEGVTPHVDESIVSALVYLNPICMPNSGTQTYNIVDGKYVPDVTVESKWNRMIAFDSTKPHSAMSLDSHNNEGRLTLLFFLNSLDIK